MSRSRSRTTTETVKDSARRGAEPPIEPDSTEWSDPHSRPAETAENTSAPEPNGAQSATERGIDANRKHARAIEQRSADISAKIRAYDDDGSETTESESVPMSPISWNSAKQSRRWKTPRNAREWAAQLNSIATGVLNGTVDLEEAKIVSSISRSAAQLLTAEVQRARFLQIEPDLSLEFAETPSEPSEVPDSPEFPE
jgi:hypothetical protein